MKLISVSNFLRIAPLIPFFAGVAMSIISLKNGQYEQSKYFALYYFTIALLLAVLCRYIERRRGTTSR